MELLPGLSIPFVPRPDEYERLVAFLLDQRFFFPVAITTSLPGGLGFGKTSLAQAVCQDPRVRKAFSEGIFWVTLGQGLTPLDLVSKIEHLIFDMTGERVALLDIPAAEARLHELLHPRRTLLVIDEANNVEALKPFLQAGPGGACLLITHNDSALPEGTRRVSVDIMMPDEAAALLSGGLRRPGALPSPAPQPSSRPDAPDFSSETRKLLEELADRLNEWPLLLTLVNGLLRSQLAPAARPKTAQLGQAAPPAGQPETALRDTLEKLHKDLAALGIQPAWRIDDQAMRKRALDGVLTTCLQPLSSAESACYFDLAVFPADEAIPLAAVMVMWAARQEDTGPARSPVNPNDLPGSEAAANGSAKSAMDLARTRALCERFADRGLIFFDRAEGAIWLHAALHASLTDHLFTHQRAVLHNRLIEAYQTRCPAGWASGPDDGYYFQHLAGHLVAAGRRADLQKLLFDFAWLEAFLSCDACGNMGARRGDVYALMADFDLALSTALDRQIAQLRLVQEALRLSTPALARDRRQLAPQLIGRLLPFQEPEIVSLMHKAIEWRGEAWLRPLAACFTPPGSQEVRVLTGHNDWITCIALLPDGQRAVSCSLDGMLRLWDLANGQVLRAIHAHPETEQDDLVAQPAAPAAGISGQVERSAAQELGNGLAGIPAPGAAPLIPASRAAALLGAAPPAAAGLPLPEARRPGGISAMVVTPDGLKAITAGWEGDLRVWNLATGQMERSIAAHGEAIGALAVTPDGKMLISGSEDRLIRVWDLESGKMVHELVGHADLIHSLAVSPDGRTLLSGSWDYTLRLWDLEEGLLMHILTGHEGWVTSVAISPDGAQAFSGSWDRTVRVWDLYTGEESRVLSGFRAPVFSLAVSPDGRLALTGGGDGSLGLWDIESGECVRTLPGHLGGVNAVALTAGGGFAVTGSDDGTLRVWDLVSVQGGRLPLGHSAPVPALANLPNGSGIVSASWDGKVKVWDPSAGRELRALAAHEGGVVAMALSADGRSAFTGGRDHTLKLWDLTTGEERCTLPGHTAAITAIAINPDATIGASADDIGLIKVWDMRAAECVAEFHGEAAIWACAISPDGRTVTASESSGKMYFLEIER